MPRTVAGYSSLQITLHWVVVVLVAFQYVASRGMEASWLAQIRDAPPPENTLPLTYMHAAAGTLVFFVAIARLFLRFKRGAPSAPTDEPRWQSLLSETVHAAIYLLLLALPISGAIAWLFSIETAGSAHELFKNLLLGAISLHVAGALFQHFVRRTTVMLRMLQPDRAAEPAATATDRPG